MHMQTAERTPAMLTAASKAPYLHLLAEIPKNTSQASYGKTEEMSRAESVIHLVQ